MSTDANKKVGGASFEELHIYHNGDMANND